MIQLELDGREPWEMTADEYIDRKRVHAGAVAIRALHNEHSLIVYQAIAEGFPVPEEVLAEYPTAALQLRKEPS